MDGGRRQTNAWHGASAQIKLRDSFFLVRNLPITIMVVPGNAANPTPVRNG
jgi:hypothetical protein